MEGLPRTMKGICLAGGLGTRLAPLTQNDNKHLLPVYNKRMIEYPIATLVQANIKDIILITGGERPGAFLELLKNGKDHDIDRLYYAYQEGNGGIADALKLAKPFLDYDESCVVILGDNYFEENIHSHCMTWVSTKACGGAHVLLKEVEEPWHFGIAEVEKDRIVGLEEKPEEAKSNLAVIGCYMFDYQVWDLLDRVPISWRGEFEITEVLKLYMQLGKLNHSTYKGYWRDMGTFGSLMEVSKRLEK